MKAQIVSQGNVAHVALGNVDSETEKHQSARPAQALEGFPPSQSEPKFCEYSVRVPPHLRRDGLASFLHDGAVAMDLDALANNRRHPSLKHVAQSGAV